LQQGRFGLYKIVNDGGNSAVLQVEGKAHAVLFVDESGIRAEVWFNEAKHLITFEGTATIYEVKEEKEE
jgi:hypothetical protein